MPAVGKKTPKKKKTAAPNVETAEVKEEVDTEPVDKETESSSAAETTATENTTM